MLSQGDPLWPLYYGVAAVVAGSRVYVKIHHPSDVVAGALLGVALGRWPAAPGRSRAARLTRAGNAAGPTRVWASR